MKKLVIVGSGQTVLSHTVGAAINEFDIVVRFNGYQHGLGVYDEYAGTKTDVIFCNNTTMSASHFRAFPKIYSESTKFILKKTSKKQLIRNMLISNGYIETNIIHYKHIFRNFTKDAVSVSIPKRISNPTLGLMSIFYCLNKYLDYNIYIYGFDRIVMNISNRRYTPHYYSKLQNFNVKHAMRTETAIIKKLINNDFIRKLI